MYKSNYNTNKCTLINQLHLNQKGRWEPKPYINQHPLKTRQKPKPYINQYPLRDRQKLKPYIK